MIEPTAYFDRIRDSSVVLIHDDVKETYWQLLRSLPALNYIGFETFTFPTLWRTLNKSSEFKSYTDQYDYLDYEYKVLGQIEEETFVDNLVVTTNEYYENETQYSIDHLVSRYSARPETLIIVTDSQRFTPRGGQRPLYHEQFVERVESYEQVYQMFEQVYAEAGFEFPLLDTMNLFLHDNANLYEFVTGNQVETSVELFEVLPREPYLPLYDVFSSIFAREDDYGSVPLDEDGVEGLQRWLRRRIEWSKQTATAVAQRLNKAVMEKGRTFDPSYATRSSKVGEARRKADKLDPTESSVHMRYNTWLQRYEL